LCLLGILRALLEAYDGKDGIFHSSGENANHIMVERLWRSLKYECIYLNAYEGGLETRRGIGSWVELYNRRRPHSSLDDRTPFEACWRMPRQGYRYKAA